MTQGKQAIAELSKVQRSDAPYRFVLFNDSLKDQAGIDFCQVVHDLNQAPLHVDSHDLHKNPA